jgi:hypothetical protein
MTDGYEEDDERKVTPEGVIKKYPYKEIIDGEEYNITGALSYKFLTQTIVANDEYSEIKDGDEIIEVDVNARIRILNTDTGKFIVELKDDIFYKTPIFFVVDELRTLANTYYKVITIIKRLGYDDPAMEVKKTELELADFTKFRKSRLIDWWVQKRLYGD